MVGRRQLPCSDPEEQRLREAFYAAEEGSNRRQQVADELARYLWQRVSAEVEEDRKRHPKKKRNLPVGHDVVRQPGGRTLP